MYILRRLMPLDKVLFGIIVVPSHNADGVWIVECTFVGVLCPVLTDMRLFSFLPDDQVRVLVVSIILFYNYT